VGSSHFDNPGARLLLAVPALVIGIGCLALGWRARWLARAALHPDGRLRQCKLARVLTLDVRTFEQGVPLTLDESGRASQ
jgi:hypothetical protein